MKSVSLISYAVVVVILLSQSCAPKDSEEAIHPVPITPSTEQEPESPVTLVTPTTLVSSFGEFKSATELNQDILEEIRFFAGGAGCSAKNMGFSERYCETDYQWPISLHLNGIFRVSDQINENQELWWGDKFDTCYETLEFGDMVYLSAKGYPEGESVRFIIDSPQKREVYDAIVHKDVLSDGRRCEDYATAPAARFSWVVSPEMGVGTYVITAEGRTGKAILNFVVEENHSPTFGISVGDTSFPLTLGSDRLIKLVYSGFQPNQTVTTLLYNPVIGEGISFKPIRYINVQMKETGSATYSINWDTALQPGQYWLFVPEIIPEEALHKALWGVYFNVDTPENYPDRLYEDQQNILLRPSCGTELTAKFGKIINLQYGIWGVNGMKLLEETKDKIKTRILIDDQEVVGYRSNQIIPMSEMPCGNTLENGYFIYSETPVGSFFNGNEVNIRVEYSFAGTITDGYDLSPNDGRDDLYTPKTPFIQSYKIRLVP